MEYKNYLLIGGIVFLCLFGIPVKINKKFNEDDKILFDNYIRNFNKSYRENDSEYLIRFQNFRKSLRLIEELNRNRSSNHSALYGLTLFSDLSQDEFFKNRLQANSTKGCYRSHFQPDVHDQRTGLNDLPRLKRAALPIKFDWRDKNIIGKVHNQRTCGACWAFSAIETVESMNALKVGSFVELSVQEAIDCAQDGNYGCEGGDSCSLLHWLAATKTKITTDKLYPFSYRTRFCKMNNLKTGVQVQNYSCNTFVGAEDKLLQKIAFQGPVIAAVNALNWQYYLGGIIQFHCPGEVQNLNHAVQIVGYDRSGPVPYYIARNSWGTEFGDKGYIYIAIGGNICGIADEVSSLNVV